MKDIIEASNLPADSKVYLKKDWTGWRVVEPIKDENGKFLWKRIMLGTTKERVFLGFLIFVALVSYLTFQEQINNYYEVLENPCSYCSSCQDHTRELLRNADGKRSWQLPDLNLSIASPNE